MVDRFANSHADASAGGDDPVVANLLYNGATWDKQRGNPFSQTITASAAQTASFNSTGQTNFNHRGVSLVLDITAVSGTTPTLDVKVQMQDGVTGKFVDIPGAAFAQQNAAGTLMLTVYPGVTVATNLAVSYPLPRIFRLVHTIGGTTPSFTFTVGATYLL